MPGFYIEVYEGELAGAINGHDEVELAPCGLHSSDVGVEIAIG
jgi:hypothetical protein